MASAWKVPARDDKGILEWDAEGLRFHGELQGWVWAPPDRVRLVRGHPRWGHVTLLTAILLVLVGVSVSFGWFAALAGALVGLVTGVVFTAVLARTNRWVEIWWEGQRGYFVVSKMSWNSGGRPTRRLAADIAAAFDVGLTGGRP